jgi:hypothetical protein
LVSAGGNVNVQVRNLMARVNITKQSSGDTLVEFVHLGLAHDADIFSGSLQGSVASAVPTTATSSVKPVHIIAGATTRNFHICDNDFYACKTGTPLVVDDSGSANTTTDNNVAPAS